MIDLFKSNGSSPPSAVDISAENHGSIFLLTGITESGRWWLEAHLDPDGQRWGFSRIIEQRSVLPILRGDIGDGLAVR